MPGLGSLPVPILVPKKVGALKAPCCLFPSHHMIQDLQAALAAEPDNPEAKALLHQRSVTVEKARFLACIPPAEIRLMACY